MKKFIILSTQRSGSTFLGTCLSSHADIQAYGEIFQPFGRKYLNDPNPPTHYKIGFAQYRGKTFARKLANKFNRKKFIYNYLDETYAIPKNKRAVGFKFMYSQAKVYPEVVDWLKDNNISVVHLIRSNFLKTIVSLELARKRGVYATTKPLDRITVSLDVGSLKDQLENRKTLIEDYRLRLEENPYMEISYEDFVESKNSQTKRLLEFLGIEDFQELTSDLAKANSDVLKDLVENYEAVVDELKDTTFETFLD